MRDTTSAPARDPARCIYTGRPLVAGDNKLKPSKEHIVPLCLGGSNQFTTMDVCIEANSRAGKEIDDEAASQLLVQMLRHRYGLTGNRGVIPNVKLKGEFEEIQGAACTLEIDSEANISVRFDREQEAIGAVVQLETTEERFRMLIRARLEQANQRKMELHTALGRIRDEDDIETLIMLAPRKEGKAFASRLTIDLPAFKYALDRLMLKIAICVGHRVLGPDWTFSSRGDQLRSALWTPYDDAGKAPVRVIIADAQHLTLARLLKIDPDKHVIAVLPNGHSTVALIALFGGHLGVAIVEIAGDYSEYFETFQDEARGGCVFEIPLAREVAQRRLATRTIRDVTRDLAAKGFDLDL